MQFLGRRQKDINLYSQHKNHQIPSETINNSLLLLIIIKNIKTL